MRLHPVSDLHLEFRARAARRFLERLPKPEADAVILAGDIAPAGDLLEMAFEVFASAYPRVLFVPGNHEYYGSDFVEADEEISIICSKFENVTLLRPGTIAHLEGGRALGGTLWFPWDMVAYTNHRHLLNDFGYIKGFEPRVYELAREHAEWLRDNVRPGDIVVTHHLPSPRSVPKRHLNDPTTAFYVHDMSAVIEAARPACWFHGHTHTATDYVLHETRIVCNPSGYPGEHPPTGFGASKVVEIG